MKWLKISEMTIVSLVYSISFKYSSFPTNCGQEDISKEKADFFLLLLSLGDTFTKPFSPCSPVTLCYWETEYARGQWPDHI